MHPNVFYLTEEKNLKQWNGIYKSLRNFKQDNDDLGGGSKLSHF